MRFCCCKLTADFLAPAMENSIVMLLKMGRKTAVEESVFSCLFSFLPKKANCGGSANPFCVKGEYLVSFSKF